MGGRPTLDLRLPRRREDGGEERMVAIPRAARQFFGEWLVHRRILKHAQMLEALAISRLHEWRIGDAVVVLRLARRTMVEKEAKRFERHAGRCEPRRLRLERRAQQLQQEEQTRRIRRAAVGDRLQG